VRSRDCVPLLHSSKRPFSTARPCRQIGNALGFLPGCLLFSAFGQSGTSIIRALLDGKTSSAEFIQSVVIIVVGFGVVVCTVVAVRRTIKRLRHRQALEDAAEAAGAAPGAGQPKYAPQGPGGEAAGPVHRGGVELVTGTGQRDEVGRGAPTIV
jgi:hypothetical protein